MTCISRLVTCSMLILPPENSNELSGAGENPDAEEKESSAMDGLHFDIFPSFLPQLVEFDVQVVGE